MNTIRSIEQPDVERVSVALARAFHHDPMMTHIVPNALARAKVLPWFLGKVVSYCIRFGEAHMSEDGMAAACWIPPRGGAKSWFERAVAAGGLVMPFVMGFRSMKRVLAMERYTRKQRQMHAREPHYYLNLLGVDPVARGRRLGRRLVEPILAKVDAERVPCYLETMNEANVAVYESLGFQLMSYGLIPESDVGVWTFKRFAPDR